MAIHWMEASVTPRPFAMVGSAALSMVDESMVANAPRVMMAACIHKTGGMALMGPAWFYFLYLRISIDIHGMTFRCDALKIYH
ncbi:hypothetical protein LNP26_27655 [Klebsiella variicola subsp. variicola]|nr:hypothetical protein [Klebsiella variicola subsp. variicola]